MTRYMIRAEVLATKKIVEEGFDSMLSRELFKIGYGPAIRVLAEWLADDGQDAA